MNKKIKKSWIERLRSATDKRGYGRLRNYKDEFCTFGILCDIIDSKGWRQIDAIWYHRGIIHSPAESVLTDCGLSRPETIMIYVWNDKERLTFLAIASKIEEIL